MSQSRTVSNVIPEINSNYYLPAIQREFEWDEKQIERLFDSIMRDLPIGSFQFWNIRGGSDDKIKYKFVKNYVDEPGFPKKKMRERNHHNPRVDDDFEDVPENITLVLDGQQRLSAFYIGLIGSYTEKKKYAQIEDEDNYRRKKLYVNLLSTKEDNSNRTGMKYELSFKEPEPPKTENNYWYEVGNILNVSDKYEEKERVRKEIEKNTDLENIPFEFDEVMDKLYDGIHEKEVVSFDELENVDEKTALEFFIRANEAGTRLSKPDLVLSLASSVWKDKLDIIENDKEVIAREEIHRFKDEMNEHPVSISSDFDVRFLLQCILACSKCSLSFSYDNFNEDKKLKKMKETWLEDRFRKSVWETLDLVDEYGLTTNYINKKSLLPVVFYFHSDDYEVTWDTRKGRENRKKILYFIASSSIGSIYSSKAPQFLRDVCKVMDEDNSNDFNISEIENTLNRYDKTMKINEDMLRDNIDKFSRDKNKSKTRLALILLSELSPANSSKEFDTDHIFPSSKLRKSVLTNEYNIDEETAKRMENKKHRIGNMQLLEKTVNREFKKDKEPIKWIDQMPDDYEISYAVDDKNLYKMENFEEFLEKREEKLIKALVSMSEPI